MGCFRLPDSLIAEIESITAKFFWHGEMESRTHWVSWSKLCRPLKEGDLGFRRLKEYNATLLAKQAWRVTTETEVLLHQVLRHRYFPRGLSLDTQCIRCAGEAEDITHVLLQCFFARFVWALTDVGTITLQQQVDCGAGWLREAFTAMESQEQYRVQRGSPVSMPAHF
ncbi:UNVERIFIED_CONTAM: hypothetical protein Slati_0547600 [Sesamum latifolium]|uniref:Reverse transcriptase zinc-binding domain-containing protein n=1 Tax=Sesamum latifolium TaxID=2727402 RepID=A0AAW2XYV7_9LAMI